MSAPVGAGANGAAAAVQTALVAALGAADGLAALSGIHDAPPARAVLPYLAIGETIASDWSVKDRRGRELRVQIVIWDEAARVGRLHALMAIAGDAAEAIARDLDGWRIASIVFLRSRIRRDATGGPWAGIVDYRIRVMEN